MLLLAIKWYTCRDCDVLPVLNKYDLKYDERGWKNRMEKMTRKVIAILTVGALIFALPFAVAADVVDYPEQGAYEAVPAPAELPPAEEPVAAPAELPPEDPVAEEPAEGIPAEEASEDALYEEALEEEEPEEDLPEEVLEEESAAAEDDELVGIDPFVSADVQYVIDQLQELRDEINWAIDAIENVGPEGFTPEQWAVFENNRAAWNAFQNAPYIEANGVRVAQGFDEVFDWLLANWDNISPADREGLLAWLNELLSVMEEVYKPGIYQFLDILCNLPEACTCPLCTRPPPQPPQPPQPPGPPTPEGPPAAPPPAGPPAAPPAVNVVGVAPQTGDTTSAQVPFVKLMMSLFAISGLSLAKFRMRDR